MKRCVPALLALLLALLLTACTQPERSEKTAEETVQEPSPAPEEQTPPAAEADPVQTGVQEADGAYYYVQPDGTVLDAQGLTEVDGAQYYFLPDHSLFRFEPGVNDCGTVRFYHIGEPGVALRTPEPGLFEDDQGLYEVLPDGSLLCGASDGYLYFGTDGRYTSGSEELDAQVGQLLADAGADRTQTQEARLRLAFDYLRDHYTYLSMDLYAAGTTDWAEDRALVFFRQGKGNCYCFAASFMYCARRLGYQAYVVAGHESRPDNDHAWTMIDRDGQSYLYDVQLEYAYLYMFHRQPVDMFGALEENGQYNGFNYYFPEEPA